MSLVENERAETVVRESALLTSSGPRYTSTLAVTVTVTRHHDQTLAHPARPSIVLIDLDGRESQCAVSPVTLSSLLPSFPLLYHRLLLSASSQAPAFSAVKFHSRRAHFHVVAAAASSLSV